MTILAANLPPLKRLPHLAWSLAKPVAILALMFAVAKFLVWCGI